MNELELLEFETFPAWLGLGLAFVWGALWGSFLNVVIHRLPRGRSIVFPASHCPACNHPIRAFDNIPILSWLLLLGRCRDCRVRIGARYPLVELLTALLSLALYHRFVVLGPAAPWQALLAPYLIFFAFAAALIAVVFIDLDHQIIPDSITFGGMVVGVLASLLLPDVAWWESLLGLVLGGAAIGLLILGYSLIRGQAGMGLGDLKLLAMIGAFLGYRSLLFVLLVGSVAGLAVALLLGLIRRVTGRSIQLYDPALLQDQEEDAADVAPADPAVTPLSHPDDPPGLPPDHGTAAAPDQGSAPSTPAPAAAQATQEPPSSPLAPPELPLHRTAIAFGPYLALAAIAYLLVGEELTYWYMEGAAWLSGLLFSLFGG